MSSLENVLTTSKRYRIVIPSRGRSKKIKNLEKLLEEFTVAVVPEELEKYQVDNPDYDIQPLRRESMNVADARQMIQDMFEEEFIVFIDDDFKHIECQVGQKSRVYKDKDSIKK